MIGGEKTLLLVFFFFLRLLLESMVEFTFLGYCLRCDISYASNKTPAPPRRARFCPRPAERDPLPPARLARASPLAVARSAPGRDARPGGSRWPATTTMTRRCVSPRVRHPARVPPTRRQFTHHHRPPSDGRARGAARVVARARRARPGSRARLGSARVAARRRLRRRSRSFAPARRSLATGVGAARSRVRAARSTRILVLPARFVSFASPAPSRSPSLLSSLAR